MRRLLVTAPLLLVAMLPRHAKPGAAMTSAQTLEQLAILATGSVPEHPPAAMDEVALVRYVDRLLDDPRFAHVVAPWLLATTYTRAGINLGFYNGRVLNQFVSKRGEHIYYLRSPCDEKLAQRVRPYWDLSHEVLVCPDSYQPEHRVDPANPEANCSGRLLGPQYSNYCGCGPNLINCMQSWGQRNGLMASAAQEVIDTIGALVAANRPIEEVFTTNATVRDRSAEVTYRSWRINSGTATPLDDIPRWDEHKLLPRPEALPGQHAGILTMPHFVWISDTQRGRLRNIFSLLWCQRTESKGVDGHQILALGATNLRSGEGWKSLAAKPVCTTCHARLDYGVQFFDGYPNLYFGNNYAPKPHPGETGPFYGNDIDDRRGTLPLTPHAFARFAVAQPEFGKCMVQHVTDHVFGGEPPADIKQQLLDQFGKDHSLRSMMRLALLRYGSFMAARNAPHAKSAASPDPATASAGHPAQVALEPALRGELEQVCGACHEGEDPTSRQGAFDASAAHIDWSSLHRATLALAGGEMPKTFAGLDSAARDLLLTHLSRALWPQAAQRERALDFLSGEHRVLPAYDAATVEEVIRARSGAATSQPAIDFPVDPELEHYVPRIRAFDTTLALAAAMQALTDCKAAGGNQADCLRRSLDPAFLVNGGVPLRVSGPESRFESQGTPATATPSPARIAPGATVPETARGPASPGRTAPSRARASNRGG
jgi:hypothetical protein